MVITEQGCGDQGNSFRQTARAEQSPIDVATERRITIEEYCRSFGIDRATGWRHAMRGVSGVKLGVFFVGRKLFTTTEAVQRFTEAVTAARLARAGGVPAAPTPTREQRQREARHAGATKRLAKRGI